MSISYCVVNIYIYSTYCSERMLPLHPGVDSFFPWGVSKKVFGMIILFIQIIFWRHKILPLQSSCSLWATSFTAKKLRSIVYCSYINDFRPNSIIFYMKLFLPWIMRYAITRSRYCLDKIRTFLFKWVLTSCKLSSYSLE